MRNKYLIISLLIISLLMVGAGCSAQSSAQEEPVINTTGTGMMTTDPDTLELNFAVATEGKDKNIQDTNAQKTQKIIDALLALGLDKEEMETQNVRFDPRYNYTNGKQQLIGYRAETKMKITTKKLDIAGKITDTVVNNGSESVGNLVFSLSDEGKEQILDKAIDKAVADARKQADATAKAAGVEILGIKQISVQKEMDRGIYFDEGLMRGSKKAQAETPIIPKDAKYYATVQMSFKIK